MRPPLTAYLRTMEPLFSRAAGPARYHMERPGLLEEPFAG